MSSEQRFIPSTHMKTLLPDATAHVFLVAIASDGIAAMIDHHVTLY
jgi:hypothetical protein